MLDAQRVSDLVAATGMPMALHGGTGLSADQFRDLIARGCAKVNISTALKEATCAPAWSSSRTPRRARQVGPADAVRGIQRGGRRRHGAREHIALFGGSGRAW